MKNIMGIKYFIVLFYTIGILGSVCLLSGNYAKDDTETIFDIEIGDGIGKMTSVLLSDEKQVDIYTCSNYLSNSVNEFKIRIVKRSFVIDCDLIENIVLFEADTSPPKIVA